MFNSVYDRVRAFNKTFGLPTPDNIPVHLPSLADRLYTFLDMLRKEVNEGDELLQKLRDGDITALDAYVDLADWLGDIQVYCASEMVRHGITIEPVMHAIMDCQDSKLVDGKPLVINGKVQKGPDYAPPEPAIAKIVGPMLRGEVK
jgi:hypothetical protein